MEKLIIGNWKMNPQSAKEAKALFDEIKKALRQTQGKGIKKSEVEVVICPPFAWLAVVRPKGRDEGGLVLGAQNCSNESSGAFTGEISAGMLKDLQVEYVIIGHSERRKYFCETDEVVNNKIKKALELGLKVIFCIGETAEERRSNKKMEILEKQVKQGLLGINNFENISVAYEPVWAIGTGNNCSVEETKESVDFIRKLLRPETKVLYGGSVNSENSSAYVKDAGADGLLVGGASLKAEEFIKIVASAN